MKRSLMIGLAVVAIFGIVTVIALVSNTPIAKALGITDPVESVLTEDVNVETAAPQAQPAVPTGQNFVDEDGDGVCDTCGSVPGTSMGNQHGSGMMGSNFVDADGNGVCDTCGNMPGTGMGNQQGNGAMGSNFVDEDGDGVCDTCGSVPGTGMGSQSGSGMMGSNFVDLDGDGVCDSCGTAPADGTGNQHGHQGGQGGQAHGGRWNN